MENDEMNEIKKNQDDYFRLITSGHCAICLCKLNLPKETMKYMDTATCSVCHNKGLDGIFLCGFLCGKDLKNWKKERR